MLDTPSFEENTMHAAPAPAPETLARILAMLVSANGSIDDTELKMLDSLDAWRRIGIDRKRFVELAQNILEELGEDLSGRGWLSFHDTDVLDPLLDEVHDPAQRLMMCRLAAAAITADGKISAAERAVYDHVLGYWHVTQTMVTQAILHDR
jgi:uncharacterized membrane protein YebE (DUF533 family)